MSNYQSHGQWLATSEFLSFLSRASCGTPPSSSCQTSSARLRTVTESTVTGNKPEWCHKACERCVSGCPGDGIRSSCGDERETLGEWREGNMEWCVCVCVFVLVDTALSFMPQSTNPQPHNTTTYACPFALSSQFFTPWKEFILKVSQKQQSQMKENEISPHLSKVNQSLWTFEPAFTSWLVAGGFLQWGTPRTSEVLSDRSDCHLKNKQANLSAPGRYADWLAPLVTVPSPPSVCLLADWAIMTPRSWLPSTDPWPIVLSCLPSCWLEHRATGSYVPNCLYRRHQEFTCSGPARSTNT